MKTLTLKIYEKFVIPNRKFLHWDAVEPKLNLYVRPGRSKPSIAMQHKSMWKNVPQLSFHEPQTDAEFRAMTPPGFAQAFFKANQSLTVLVLKERTSLSKT